MLLKVKHGMAKSVDPDQTAPKRSSLIRVCTVCTNISVPILGIFMVQVIKCLNKTFAMKQLSIKIYIQTAVNV